MAYAAVISLKQTIQSLVNSSHISNVLNSSSEIIELAYKEIQPLQEVLERFDSNTSSRERVNSLDGRIREAVCKLEDVVESHVSNQILSQSEESLEDESRPLSFSLDLQEVKQDIDSVTKTLKKMKEEYFNELSNPSLEEDVAVSSREDFGGKKSKVVGLSHEYGVITTALAVPYMHFYTVSLIGMPGIGKSTLAREIYEHPHVSLCFQCRAWVTVGPKYQLKQILLDILAQVNPNIDKISKEGDKRLAKYLTESLRGRRYLIVLDDIWSSQVWKDLKELFEYSNNGSRVLLTTRLKEVANYAGTYKQYEMRLLNKEESWCLLRERVFAEELCPPELVKAGKKIAENCEGLPLTIVTVADLLSKAEKTPEYWNKVAEKENSVFMEANDQMLKVLLPSYNYLPQHLKACFLYMGVFPENSEIPHSKLIKLWSAEGFLEPNLEDFALECLGKLVSGSLVMVCQKNYNDKIKTCRLHSAFWHLCIRQAGKNKFSHVMNSYADSLAEGIKSQRRLCIHKNILFGIKDVYNSMASISTARSLLCTGPPHQYPVPICFGLMLLRVLDALTIRFYEFPVEVLKLVQLRYLALTCDGKLPPSISKLWSLQCLIVSRHLSIKSPRDSSYLPVEIWDMQELKHLQIMGSNLPDRCGALLPNLLALLDVSARSCTKGVLERIHNLKKLGIQIEMLPDAAEPLCCFDHISHLNKLESFKCVIVNPIFRTEVVAPPPSLSIFPSGLKKLSLSGFGYPWKEMSKIASLPNLEVLKLRCYAFQGPKWETRDREFNRLKFFLIEDTDLVDWRASFGSFLNIQCLSIKHCYKLEDIPIMFRARATIEVVDCNPLAVTVKEPVRVKMIHPRYSWDDGNLK
ncbi:hypothetical protein Pfo_020808 [Paulownia fortunei]|nr:hypothetical protein Pfo_020808 [Paulownia fortunei]